MVLIGYVYVRSAAIYCIKNDSGLESLFAFYSICLLFAGIYGILKKRSGGFLFDAGKGLCMQSGVSADRKDRKILCMTSVKGYRYRQRHSR